MSFGRAITTLILSYPYKVFDFEPSDTVLITEELNKKSLNGKLSSIITELYNDVDIKELNNSIAEVLVLLAYISTSITTVTGISTSIKSLFELCDETPEIWELMNWEIPTGLQFNEIEDLVSEKANRFFDLVKASNNEYGKLVRANSIINLDQFKQTAVNISLKPDLFGKVISEPINTNFMRGFRNYTDVYINAIGARKALINNFSYVRKSGYLARKLVLLVTPYQIDANVDDCETRHFLFCKVLTKTIAQRLIGRYYYDPEGDVFGIVESNNYDNLIGKEIFLRSPARCALKNNVCKTCYGVMSKSNADIHAGIYGSLYISEQITQRLLSSKHLLKTDSVVIDWPPIIKNQFIIDRSSIIAEANTSQIIINKEDITDQENTKTVTRFVYQKRTGREQYIVESPIELALSANFINSAIDDKENNEYVLKIPASQTEGIEIFTFSVENNELSSALVSIFSLIEQEENDDLDEMFNDFMSRVDSTGIDTPSVNIEMILRALIRNPLDITNAPDYSNDNLPAEVILKLLPAIINTPSITNSLAFERIKSQLMQPTTYEKTNEGVFDILFK